MTTTRPARLTASAGGSGALPRRTVVSAGAATAVGLALAACGSKDAGGDTGGDGRTVTSSAHSRTTPAALWRWSLPAPPAS